jgi:hypothetical protein
MCSTQQLEILNIQMGMQGIDFSGTLRFFTHVFVFRVSFEIGFTIEKFDQFSSGWDSVLVNGTLGDATGTLNLFQPWLPHDQINTFWSGVHIPE